MTGTHKRFMNHLRNLPIISYILFLPVFTGCKRKIEQNAECRGEKQRGSLCKYHVYQINPPPTNQIKVNNIQVESIYFR